jgi:hypothetical protein
MMRWEDERYVRAYTRDTPNWILSPWQAKAIFFPVLRKLDRAGLFPLGEYGLEGLAAAIMFPLEVVEAGMVWWLGPKVRTFEIHDGVLVMPKFIEAQEAAQSDAARKRAERDRARARVTKRDSTSQTVTESTQNVTESHEPSHAVTDGHDLSLCAVPSRAVPSLTNQPDRRDPSPSAPAVEPLSLEPTPVSRKSGKGKARKTLVPDDFAPSAETVAMFAADGWDALAVVAEFVSYWRGEGEPKADWEHVFRNRVRSLIAVGRCPKLAESGTHATTGDYRDTTGMGKGGRREHEAAG